jgi:hypothetical protein
MRVLVACEFSGIVRDAFIAAGHDAVSCDLLPSERPGPHIQGDALAAAESDDWDLLIAHPPCTYLSNSGVRWLYGGKGKMIDPVRWGAMQDAADFFAAFFYMDIPRIAVENPIMHGYGRDRILAPVEEAGIEPVITTVQPWQFGTPETKATQLWLVNLPPLVPTNIVEGRTPRVHFASPGPNRWAERSRTDPGIAAAMADQWGNL